MENSQLNEYSRRFAAVLFADHPEWREFASVDTTEGVDRYADDQEAEEFAEALAFITDLLAERIAIISWWDEGEWCGSSRVVTGTEGDKPEWARSAKTARIRSWRGAYDRDIAG